MALEVRNFAVSTPAGTALATPRTTDLSMPARLVRSVRVRVPPGPAGLLGWALASSGVNIIPWGAAQWMVQDNEVTDLPLEGQITSGAWQLRTYNTGLYAHVVYVTFFLDPLPSQANSGLVTAPLNLGP